jgi:quercetin dioxygenase-like cupin family protein
MGKEVAHDDRTSQGHTRRRSAVHPPNEPGVFGLMEMVAPTGREPSRHLHHTDDEGFYVLEGNVTFYVGEETYEASPGTFTSGSSPASPRHSRS